MTMGNNSHFACGVILLLISLTIKTSSQSNTTTIINTDYFDPSTFYSTIEPETETNGNWVYAMFVSGILGIILTSIMGIHASYHLFRQSLGGKCQRIFYVLLFISYWLVCVAYTFFKTDIVIPSISTLANCRVGYFMCTSSVYLAKLLLFIVFILRIDIAFHSSALGYNRIFLGILVTAFTLIESLLYLWYIYEAWSIIEYIIDYELFIPVGICTLGTEITTAHSILALLFIFDMIFSIIVCALFIYKLNKVVKLSGDQHKPKSRKNSKLAVRSNSVASKNDKLLKLMKKQTILVILAILTSFLVLGLGAQYNPISLLIPLDSIANTFCVWLMFSFANDIWNKIIKYLCCCCCCCGMNEEHFLQRGNTFGRTLSKRLSFQSRSGSGSTSTNRENNNKKGILKQKTTELPPISERVSVKNKDIEIKFENDFTSNDLNKPKVEHVYSSEDEKEEEEPDEVHNNNNNGVHNNNNNGVHNNNNNGVHNNNNGVNLTPRAELVEETSQTELIESA